MRFPLNRNTSHALPPAGPRGKVEVISTMPPITSNSDYTVLELKGINDEIYLHFSFRPAQGFIAINAADSHGWDYNKEIRVPFGENFPGGVNAKITIKDLGDQYSIIFGHGAEQHFKKLSSHNYKTATTVRYHTDQANSVFSETVFVETQAHIFS